MGHVGHCPAVSFLNTVEKTSVEAASRWRLGGDQGEIVPRHGGVAAAEGLFAPSHTWAAAASVMNGAGLAAPPRLRGGLRPTPFGRAPQPPHARSALRMSGQGRLNQQSHNLLVPNQALVSERPPGCESGALLAATPCIPSRCPTGLEPVAFALGGHPGQRRGPDAARSAKDNHAA